MVNITPLNFTLFTFNEGITWCQGYHFCGENQGSNMARIMNQSTKMLLDKWSYARNVSTPKAWVAGRRTVAEQWMDIGETVTHRSDISISGLC
jgi:hypothetical protein